MVLLFKNKEMVVLYFVCVIDLDMCIICSNCCNIMLYVFRLRFLLSQKVHLMCYRIFVRALTAIITYHNRYNMFNIQQHYQLPSQTL